MRNELLKSTKKKRQTVSNDTNIPVRLLLPSPLVSSSVNYKSINDGVDVPSLETNNQNDDNPFSIFQSEFEKTRINQQQETNLMIDWNKDENNVHNLVQESVCLTFIRTCLLLSRIYIQVCLRSVLS